jgi:hypothetical protein
MSRRPGSTPPRSNPPSGAPEQRVVELLHAVDTPAPERLHRQVQEMVDAHGRSGRARKDRARATDSARTPRELIRARLTPTLAAMAIAAVAGIAVALLSGGSAHKSATTTKPLGLEKAAALTLSAATAPAPRESPAHNATLDVAVEGVSFPYWAERYGWRATGERTDTFDGHPVTTVFYAGPHAGRIGYAIVGGSPAPGGAPVSGGSQEWRAGVPYRILHEHGEPVVAWRRAGHLCVLSGHHVTAPTLLALAAWKQPRRV